MKKEIKLSNLIICCDKSKLSKNAPLYIYIFDKKITGQSF